MQTFGAYLVAALAASSELVSALPHMDIVKPRAGEGQTLSVPVKHNIARRSKIQHPALVYAKALNKYNATLPSHVQAVVDRFRLPSSFDKRQAGEGSVTNSPTASDSEYVATIQVGTPAQSLPMDFDTGSSDLWVMGTTISGAPKTYNPSDSSSSSKMTGSSWTITYGDGSSSSGDVYKDAVTIGNLTASNQAVEVATKVSAEFTQDSSISGLVGLAMSSINTVKPKAQNTFFDNIKSSLSQAVFTADLKHNKDGTYNFGYLDDSQHTGTIYYADLVTSGQFGGFWTFSASGYAVGGGSSNTSSSPGSSSSGTTASGTGTPSSSGSSSTDGFGNGIFGGDSGIFSSDSASESDSGVVPAYISSWLDKKEKKTVKRTGKPKPRLTVPTKTTTPKRTVTLTNTAITGIADTGTTLLMLPDAVVSAYYAQVSGAKDSQQEGGWVFSCSASLPDFTFGVGSGQITIPGDYINYMAVDQSGQTCYGGIQSDAGIGMAIFGDVALKSAFVVFDSAGSRVGWAAKTLS